MHAYNELKYFHSYLPLLSAGQANGQANEQATPFFVGSREVYKPVPL